MRRIVVLGGYGAFGGRVAERLAREPGIEVIVGGRSLERAQAFAAGLAPTARAKIATARIDGETLTARELAALRAFVLINASGPYQDQDYALARACIAAGVHYLDLADARAFAVGIGALDAEAKAAGVLVVSGASTVPALSGAVVDRYAPSFASMRAMTTIIAPGNSFDPGLATTQSILRSLGRPLSPAGETKRFGWQGLERRVLPGLGARWIGDCDAPDLALFPQRYAGVETVRVCAALEVGALHLALWGLSWLVRAGAMRRPERLAAPLLAAKRYLRRLGTGAGGMTVTLDGTGLEGEAKQVIWHLVAKSGHGPNIPATPSVILAKMLLAGSLATRGAMACVGLFTLDDFTREVADLDVTTGIA